MLMHHWSPLYTGTLVGLFVLVAFDQEGRVSSAGRQNGHSAVTHY